MVAFGALVAIYWAVSKEDVPTPFELLVAGAAAPSLLANAVSTFLSRESTTLGRDDAQSADGAVTLRDIFVAGP